MYFSLLCVHFVILFVFYDVYYHSFNVEHNMSMLFRDKVGASCVLSGKDENSTNICMGNVTGVNKGGEGAEEDGVEEQGQDQRQDTIVLAMDRNLKSLVEQLEPIYVDFFDHFSFSTITTDQALGNLVNLFLPENENLRKLIVGGESERESVTFNNEKFETSENLNSHQVQRVRKLFNRKTL